MRLLLPHYVSNDPRDPCGSFATKHPSCLRGLMLLLCLALDGTCGMRAAQTLTPDALELTYTVRVDRPTTHLVAISIVARHVETANLKFVMPAWGPGRYALYVNPPRSIKTASRPQRSRLKSLEPMSGIEPLTPSLPRTCSTN